MRWYYAVWERLPEVRSGLFGRGVIGLSEAGHARMAGLPRCSPTTSSPRWRSRPGSGSSFPLRESWCIPRGQPATCCAAGSAPLGVNQLAAAQGAPEATARTRPRDLLAMIRARPLIAPQVAVFLAVAVLARRQAAREVRRREYSTWLRDESSRS